MEIVKKRGEGERQTGFVRRHWRGIGLVLGLLLVSWLVWVFVVALYSTGSGVIIATYPPPPSVPSPAREAARSVAEKLRELTVKYNRPTTLLLGTSSPVELVIQTDKLQNIDDLLKGFPGEIRTALVRAGTRASASLTGEKDKIEITLRGDPLRAITTDAPVTWIWDVKPLKPGDVQVVLEVFTHVKIDGDEAQVQMRVLQDTWTVHATPFEWLKYYAAEVQPIWAFLGALVSAVVATLGYFGFKGWKGAKPSANES
jgi:hypothetical protein